MSLDAGHPDYFHQVMGACRTLSDSGREIDGLDDLLSEGIRSCSIWRSIVKVAARNRDM